MPPKRRSAGAGPKSNQSTLAFHGTSNKVTKPGTRATNAKKNLLNTEAIAKKDVAPEVTPVKGEEEEDVKVKAEAEEEAPTTAEAAIIEQTAQAQEAAQSTPEEDEARALNPKQLQAYWKTQNAGKAPRYHQEGLSLEEKILRKFDMTAQYGPCVGIARLKRWKRAQRLGLEPPIEVLAVLLQEQDTKDKISVQRSVMDEILNSRNEIEA